VSQGPAGIQKGRGIAGLRTLSATTAATVAAEKIVIANPT
jgi:hypothetical protein